MTNARVFVLAPVQQRGKLKLPVLLLTVTEPLGVERYLPGPMKGLHHFPRGELPLLCGGGARQIFTGPSKYDKVTFARLKLQRDNAAAIGGFGAFQFAGTADSSVQQIGFAIRLNPEGCLQGFRLRLTVQQVVDVTFRRATMEKINKRRVVI